MAKKQADLKALRSKLDAGDPLVGPLLAAFDRVDDKKAIAAIVKELGKSFARYAKEAKQPITSIGFYWAGAEVSPWVPSDVMGNVYAGKTLLLDSCGGFTPIPLPELCMAAEDGELGDHDAFDDLRALFVAKSIELAGLAIKTAAASEAFGKLTIKRPFTFVATPGHDEPAIVLHTLP